MSRDKININIGTIGHVDHGKTSLAAAITSVLAEAFPDLNKSVTYEQIDKAPEEKARGITINATTIEYQIKNKDGKIIHFTHTDCPGHADYVKNMASGAAQIDIAILVVAATDGVAKQTREHVLLATQLGVGRMCFFVNKCDMVDDEDMKDIVRSEVEDLLKEYKFIRDEDGFRDTDIIYGLGSAVKALEKNKSDMDVIKDFILKIAELPVPLRDIDKPFLMPVEDVFSITGRGTVVSGLIEQGKCKVGDALEIIGGKEVISATVIGTQAFRKDIDEAEAGWNVGILLRGVKKEDIERGMMLCAPGSVKTCMKVKATAYILSKEEGGRHSPFFSGYRPQFYVKTADVTGTIVLPANVEMVMPGDHIEFTIEFERSVPFSVGRHFAIREGGKTVGSGFINEILA